VSQINDDKKVLLDGRKNPLKGAEESRRDQAPSGLIDQLNELNVGLKISQIWSSGNSLRQEWLDRQEEFLADWDEFLESKAGGPFEGSSSLHIPMPFQVAKTMHARFLQALIGIDPYFTTKARTEGMIERAGMVQDLMAYTLKDWINEYEGCDEVLDTWVWEWVTAGCGIMKSRWETTYERFVDVQQVAQPHERFAVDPRGNPVTVTETKLVEKEVPITKIRFRGPMLENRRPEDVLIVGGAGDPKKADAVIDSYNLNASQLWTFADQKVFSIDAVEEVIKGGPDTEASNDTTSIKQQRATNAGQSSLDTDSDLDQYKILEAYLKLDVDGSGINTDVVVWVHARSRQILRATYLHRINKSGERPFFKIDFHKRPGQAYGIGLVEMLHPLSKEMDAIHNMRVDFGLLSTMPFGFYKPTSSIEPTTLSLSPGALIPLDDPQRDVYFPNLGNRTAFGFQEEQALQTMVERLTGVNDMGLGAMTGAQGATRTATGARALLGEQNANLDVYLRRLQRGWKRCLKYMLHMLQQRLPDGFGFRITGEAGADYWRYIKTQQDICGDYDFEISPNTTDSNPQIQQQTAQEILSLVLNPLAMQMGIVQPQNVYEAYKQMFKAKGVKDFGKYISAPQGYQYLPTPFEEINRVLRGEHVPVVPQMDHQGFLAVFQEIHDSDELLGQFGEHEAVALAAQAKQHEQMLAALQAQQAQVANQQQMHQNAAMSAQQAPPGMSAMAQPVPSATGMVGSNGQ
jgi:hypothetical protein